MMKRALSLYLALAAAGILSSACGFERQSSVAAPSQATPGSAGGTGGGAPTNGPSYLGTWASQNLTVTERLVVRQLPVDGQQSDRDQPVGQLLHRMRRQHHDRWDGSGTNQRHLRPDDRDRNRQHPGRPGVRLLAVGDRHHRRQPRDHDSLFGNDLLRSRLRGRNAAEAHRRDAGDRAAGAAVADRQPASLHVAADLYLRQSRPIGARWRHHLRHPGLRYLLVRHRLCGADRRRTAGHDQRSVRARWPLQQVFLLACARP